MIERNHDSENKTKPSRSLEYSTPEYHDNVLHRATLAVVLGIIFIPFSTMVCNGLIPAQPLSLILLLLPLTGLAIGVVLAVDRMATDRTRRRARSAIWLCGTELILFAIVAMILPTLGKPREAAQRIKCASNLKQIGLALQVYVQSNNDVYPPLIRRNSGRRGSDVCVHLPVNGA